MAGNTDLRSIVDRFASELETAVQRRVNAEFASRFDELKGAILSGVTKSPTVGGSTFRRKPGPKSGYTAELKACPACGKLNKARRFSYLCEDHRSPENLAKFKAGKTKGPVAAAPTRRAAGRTKTAAKTVQRGPGRSRKAAGPATDAKG